MNKVSFKKCLIIFLLACVIAFGSFYSLLVSQTTKVYALEQQQIEWTYYDCVNVIKFLKNNFDEFVDNYNETATEDNQLLAENIEYTSIIWLVEDKNYGAYIDFNGDNGYIVVTGDYTIYDLQTDGDYVCLRKITDLYFSYLDGFLYKDENEIFQRVFYQASADAVGVSETPVMPLKSSQGANSSDTVYPGQVKAGDGNIERSQILNYVAARYPDYIVCERAARLRANFKYSLQTETSYYIKALIEKDGTFVRGYWSEGNCVLNSLYMAMLSWQKNGYLNNLPGTTIDLTNTITSDPLYEFYGRGIVREGEKGGKTKNASSNSNDDSEGKYHKWITNNSRLITMPVLYQNIRDYAVKQYGYTPESNFYFSDVPAVGKYVANTLYNNNIDIVKSSSITNALENIMSKAVFLGINNSSTYGNHGVVIIGYYKFEYTISYGSFNFTKYAYFYEIADGWSTESRIFDPNTNASPSMWAYYLK